jgi:hypothetical protein
MTREWWAARLPYIQAFVDGKIVERYSDIGNDWIQITDPAFDDKACNYRIRPEPKLRPWKIEEVPVGAVMREKLGTCMSIMLASSTNGIDVWIDLPSDRINNAGALSNYEWRYPHETEWKPCGVEESA